MQKDPSLKRWRVKRRKPDGTWEPVGTPHLDRARAVAWATQQKDLGEYGKDYDYEEVD